MVDQVAVDHGLAIGVGEDRVAEDVGRVQRRRGGQADLHGVEIFQHAPVFRDVVLLAPEAQFGVRHLAVEQIAAVALVDDHQVVLVDGRRLGRVGGVEHPLDQPLDGADVHLGFGLGRRRRPAPSGRRCRRRSCPTRPWWSRTRLPPDCRARCGPRRSRCAGTAWPRAADRAARWRAWSCRCRSPSPPACDRRSAASASSTALIALSLIGAQRKAELERLRLQRGGRRVLVDLQQPGKPVRRRPVDQRAAVVGGAARVAEPDAALGLDLLQVGTAVGGEDEGHVDARPTVRRRSRSPRVGRDADWSSARPGRWRPRRSCAAASPRPRRPAWCRRTARSRRVRSRSAIRQSPCCGPWRGGACRCSAASWCRLPSRGPAAAGR